MRNRSITLSILAAIVLCSFTSCENEKPKNSEALISKAFHQKIESFKANKRSECLDGIMVDAEVLVDSIIAQQLNLDTIDFPRKPIKPNSPSIKDIPEAFELEPMK